ncbi:MAG TPA: ribosome biogenesis GTPase Der, partial [Acidimicrobiales bacterium]|nr:ribosome biogenesis GTPase Der [Acidimicrobiales bacterium]
MTTLPVVAVVGRPNVGKSTLLNRIVGRRAAIVEEKPGVTRDRKVVEADWNGRRFQLVDTGGWMQKGTELDDKVSAQSRKAWEEADVILFVVDAAIGVTPEDQQVAKHLRGTSKPVLLIANKVDGENREAQMWELLKLGIGDPMPVSALHGRGSGDMLDEVVKLLPEAAEGEIPEDVVDDGPKIAGVAIVGRPNVGKSTLFNRMIGEERSVVHDMPGTTRDTVDTIVETDEGTLRFLDTAGMRRKSKIDEGTEYYSLVRALQAVDESDIAVLVIDATDGVTAQDQRLAERIDASGSPVVILLNKWELL